jgi:hypothetical protein
MTTPDPSGTTPERGADFVKLPNAISEPWKALVIIATHRG